MTVPVEQRGLLGRAGRADGGAATVLVVGVTTVCLALLAGGVELARVVVTSHRAAAVADLAALAAAQQSSAFAEDAACPAAARVAALNGASLVECVMSRDGTVTVWVSAVCAGPWPRVAVARSRAGPAGTAESSSTTHRAVGVTGSSSPSGPGQDGPRFEHSTHPRWPPGWRSWPGHPRQGLSQSRTSRHQPGSARPPLKWSAAA